MWQRMTHTRAPAAVILIRLLVGAVFLSEGIQKFLFPDQLGVGRFLKIGLPRPMCSGRLLAGSKLCAGSSYSSVS